MINRRGMRRARWRPGVNGVATYPTRPIVVVAQALELHSIDNTASRRLLPTSTLMVEVNDYG